MVKKVLAAAAAVIVLVAIATLVWARSILATETVRTAIASQISNAIGQPVAIGGIGASIFPRVTIDLDHVTIGQPPRIQVETLHVATGFRALLSRRIEHGALRLVESAHRAAAAGLRRRSHRGRARPGRDGRLRRRDRLDRRDRPERRRDRERFAHAARRHRGVHRGAAGRAAIGRARSRRHVDHGERPDHRHVRTGW